MKECTPITWKTWEPVKAQDFPCLLCKKREAVVMTEIRNKDGLELNLPLCAFCAGFPEDELVGRLLRKEGE